jgi:phosphoribosylformimino-5-aminoimidazole carboxamide ribotide isomerase
MMTGPNYPYTNKLAESGNIPVIASGGVGNLEHLKQLKEYPRIWGVIVGRALYEGTISLKEALELAKK